LPLETTDINLTDLPIETVDIPEIPSLEENKENEIASVEYNNVPSVLRATKVGALDHTDLRVEEAKNLRWDSNLKEWTRPDKRILDDKKSTASYYAQINKENDDPTDVVPSQNLEKWQEQVSKEEKHQIKKKQILAKRNGKLDLPSMDEFPQEIPSKPIDKDLLDSKKDSAPSSPSVKPTGISISDNSNSPPISKEKEKENIPKKKKRKQMDLPMFGIDKSSLENVDNPRAIRLRQRQKKLAELKKRKKQLIAAGTDSLLIPSNKDIFDSSDSDSEFDPSEKKQDIIPKAKKKIHRKKDDKNSKNQIPSRKPIIKIVEIPENE
ncbi:MAG: hypothetical protein GY714_03435, partial [Desulfobacterales bacterium]|nr:hypothetical protein [Desulfobacterales bacterium]